MTEWIGWVAYGAMMGAAPVVVANLIVAAMAFRYIVLAIVRALP